MLDDLQNQLDDLEQSLQGSSLINDLEAPGIRPGPGCS